MIEDIEGLYKIKDYSLYITIALLSIFSLITFVIYKTYKDKKNTPPTKEQIALQGYKEINFENPKKAAYLITRYGYILAKDQKSKEIFKELLNDLKRYKYKKDVKPFDSKTIGLYNLFLEVVTNE